MSFAVMGLTHCSKCGTPLNGFKCPSCEFKREKENQEKLDMLLDFSIEEIQALKCLVQHKVKEKRKSKLQMEILRLEKELEDCNE